MINRFDSLENLNKERYLVRCPVCGQEYLPAELFMPSDFLGNPKDIVKRRDGKIDFYLGEEPTLETDYICDNCGTKFKTVAKVYFESSVEDSFVKDYETKLKVNIKSNEVDLFENTSES